MKRRVLLLFLLPLAFVSGVSAQTTTGLGIDKTCPGIVPPNTAFQCTFTVQNLDPANPVNSLAVTNTVPCVPSGGVCGPGSGPPVPVPCNVNGVPVTTLNAFGTPGDTCTGTVDETSPPCDPAQAHLFIDDVAATGVDFNGGGIPLPVSADAAAAVLVLACTPTPTPTSTPTPTPTPTSPSTGTPTPTVTIAQVPTLNEWGMLLFGLMIAGAGLLLARRR